MRQLLREIVVGGRRCLTRNELNDVMLYEDDSVMLKILDLDSSMMMHLFSARVMK